MKIGFFKASGVASVPRIGPSTAVITVTTELA